VQALALSLLALTPGAGEMAVPQGGRLTVLDHDGAVVREVFAGEPSSDPRRPRFSPDGSTIAYGDRGGVWIVGVDGSGRRRLSDGDDPDWSPDGSTIVFTRFRGGRQKLWVMDADGGSRRAIPHAGQAASPVWAPDGRRIAFNGYGAAVDGWATIAPDGSDRQTLPSGIGDDVRWSPDGTRIAFTRTDDIVSTSVLTVAADGSDERVVTDRGALPAATEWSPDGTRLLYLAPGEGNTLKPDLWAINVDGTCPTRLTWSHVGEGAPGWSHAATAPGPLSCRPGDPPAPARSRQPVFDWSASRLDVPGLRAFPKRRWWFGPRVGQHLLESIELDGHIVFYARCPASGAPCRSWSIAAVTERNPRPQARCNTGVRLRGTTAYRIRGTWYIPTRDQTVIVPGDATLRDLQALRSIGGRGVIGPGARIPPPDPGRRVCVGLPR
jgi:hypothetical protein